VHNLGHPGRLRSELLHIERHLFALCPGMQAMAAAVANRNGFADGFSSPAARAAGVWVFLATLPFPALACLSAWRMGLALTVRMMNSS